MVYREQVLWVEKFKGERVIFAAKVLARSEVRGFLQFIKEAKRLTRRNKTAN